MDECLECHVCAEKVAHCHLIGECIWPTLLKMWINKLLLLKDMKGVEKGRK